MKLLCITDPRTHLQPDSTVKLYEQLAQDPAVTLYHATPQSISETPYCPAAQVSGPISFADFQSLNSLPTMPLRYSSVDLVFSRADDPLPPRYDHYLALHEGLTHFVNSPRGMLLAGPRSFHQRIAGDLLPDWIATHDTNSARAFIEKHRDVVAKVNQSYGGKGVRRIRTVNGQWEMQHYAEAPMLFTNLIDLLEELFDRDPEPFEFVRFLKNIGRGDKRVLVIDGAIIGAYLRRSRTGGWIHNGTLGGYEEPCDVEARELAVIKRTLPEYERIGIRTLGYDFLVDDDGAWILSEINAGNIGGYYALELATQRPVIARIIEWLKQQCSAPRLRCAP